MTKPMIAGLLAIAAVMAGVAAPPDALAQATTTSPSTELVNPAALDVAFSRDVAEAHARLIQADNEARLAHRIALMEHDEAIFAWQRWASEVLLWVVVAVVLCGLAFSGYQLVVVMEMARQRLKRRQAVAADAGLAGNDNAGPNLESKLALSAERLEVTSSVVGVTVLVISIAFLYLFVREVYTITPLSASLAATEAVAPE